MSEVSTPSNDDTAEVPLGILTVRNALLALTTVLVLAVLLMAFNVMRNAQSAQAVAERSMALNRTIDNLTQMMFAVADERTAVGAGYGYVGPAPDSLQQKFTIQRRTADISYEVFLEQVGAIPDFDAKDQFLGNLSAAFDAYYEIGDTVESDLASPAEDRELRNRDVIRALDTLIMAGSQLMNASEATFNTGNTRIEAVRRLKRQLWQMLEYSGRDSAAIAENIASGEPLSAIKLQVVSQYGGIVRSSWAEVQNIVNAELADTNIRGLIDNIEESFFGEFDLLRDDVYTAAEFEEPYPVTAEEWIEAGARSATPVHQMSSDAAQLATQLNEESVAQANTSYTIALAGVVVTLIIGALGYWVVFTRVVRPVNDLSSTMQELAQGRLEYEVPHVTRADEVGAMARSVQVFKENAIERQRLEAERSEAEKAELERQAQAERDRLEREAEARQRQEELEEEAREERRKGMLAMADQFEAALSVVVDNLSQSAKDMETAAEGLASTAKETSAQSQTVANAAEQASSNANMVAASAEELSSSVREITGQTNQSSESARDAVGRTERAAQDVAELESAAQKIGEVVQLINDIAEQTNLLALNATIEAARAGDAGKGFAVVASEVKSLASQTANATDEISAQVEGMQKATSTAVRAMNDIRTIISSIESTAVSIASAVEEQDASTQEIARNVAEVSAGTGEVTLNIRGVNEGASTTGTAANDVLQAAQALTGQAATLREEVDGFLKQIRSKE